MAKVHEKLQQYGIKCDSELGLMLLRLDKTYADIERCGREILKMKKILMIE